MCKRWHVPHKIQFVCVRAVVSCCCCLYISNSLLWDNTKQSDKVLNLFGKYEPPWWCCANINKFGYHAKIKTKEFIGTVMVIKTANYPSIFHIWINGVTDNIWRETFFGQIVELIKPCTHCALKCFSLSPTSYAPFIYEKMCRRNTLSLIRLIDRHWRYFLWYQYWIHDYSDYNAFNLKCFIIFGLLHCKGNVLPNLPLTFRNKYWISVSNWWTNKTKIFLLIFLVIGN